ncbi:MAG: bacillithiol biosynthesis cysteine-adding enzyme BshC [Planctomycetes bacterium]|nr:bacillithiol biosynthesis cysteine-adding enzyme BshC [Planctomycetota bacterium]MCW8137118.1 bacillithiol biosynthesis cysteine-adding enzyme BshC [Planctomycetota bacterium]
MKAMDPNLFDSGNDLGRRYVTDFARVETFYAGDYRRPEHLAAFATRLLNRTWKPRFDRKLAAQLLRDYTAQHHAPQAVHANIDKLEAPDCVCVVTGQQAGLGGGPLLALYKAVTAIRLAREVESISGQPCVPVFWNASDDSDVEEVNRLRGIKDGKLTRFRFKLNAGKRHVREIVLPSRDDPQWGDAAAALNDGPYAERATVLLRDAAGRDFGTAFTRLMLELLGGRGLVVIEPKALAAHPAWRRIHAAEIENADEHAYQVLRMADRLESNGLPAGVNITNHLNLFVTVNGERRHVSSDGKRFFIEGREEGLSRTALLKELKDNPAGFTPNVLLRPLVQNAIFPTVAYVGGMAEIAYHGLLKPLHRSLSVFMPALFPRLSMTILRNQDARLFDEAVAFRRRLKRHQAEAGIVEESTRAGIKEAFAALRTDLLGLGRGLEPELQRLEQRTQRGVADVMNRVQHDALALMEGGSNLEPILNRYFPEDKPQERVISLLSLYAELGPQLIELAEDSGDVFDFQHRAAVV